MMLAMKYKINMPIEFVNTTIPFTLMLFLVTRERERSSITFIFLLFILIQTINNFRKLSTSLQLG